MEEVNIFRIVLASPDDVRERRAPPRVLEELNRGVAADRKLRQELRQWDADAYQGFHPKGPQELIDPTLRIQDRQLLIAIFWNRFGNPVWNADSGAEHEIRLAYEASQATGWPKIFIYFNQQPYTPKRSEDARQWKAVLNFKERFVKEKDGLWWDYKGAAEWEGLCAAT